MIRPFTFICMLLAGASGLYLYQSKHQAQLLDREIARTVKQAEAARERAGVLRAEYTRLNDPQRLAELANDHLTVLKSTTPRQFTTWAELEKRLPAVGTPPAAAPPLEPEAPAATLPETRPAETRPAETKPEAARAAEARPDAARPVATVHAATGGAPPAGPAAPARQAPAAPAPRVANPPVSLTTSLQTPAAPPRQPAPATRPVTVAAVVARPPPPHGAASEQPGAPAMTSSLGMARTMLAAPAVPHASPAAIWRPSANDQQARAQ